MRAHRERGDRKRGGPREDREVQAPPAPPGREIRHAGLGRIDEEPAAEQDEEVGRDARAASEEEAGEERAGGRVRDEAAFREKMPRDDGEHREEA